VHTASTSVTQKTIFHGVHFTRREKEKWKKERCKLIKIIIQARLQWLTPVILAAWEAKIRRIMVQG
jgi:hypothetical protein